mgnify:CR=1 FL=1
MLQVRLAEVERTFLCCPRADPGLMHEAGVRNHYRSAPLQAVSTVHCRWVVWSLASRERRQGVPALATMDVMDTLQVGWNVTCDM